ncbi:hypothetical protein AB0J63_48935 [Streptosporangium canum]|uniref:hypothetical protein n=1 Tax=Streptosporangium canum TaxID=324952 RepID=UPI003445013C
MRLTAQRILVDHLRDDRLADQHSTLPAAPAFWEGMHLDLTGATLIDFNLTDGHVADALFDGATFTEDARLGEAVVVDPVAAHVWPDGWRLETTPEGIGRLIREEADRDPAQDA